MWNILKSLNYQLKRDTLTILAILIAIFAEALILFDYFANGYSFSDITGSSYAIATSGTSALIVCLFTLFLVTRICGWDFNDKTINFEIMSGHSRFSVYLSRVAASFLWSAVSIIVLIFLPLLFFTLVNGWGTTVDATDMMLRLLLGLFPVFRGLCIWVLLTFLLRSGNAALVISFLYVEFSIGFDLIVSELSDLTLTWQLYIADLLQVWSVTDYKPDYINGEDVLVYQAAMTAPEVWSTILASLGVGAVCLLLSYLVFRRGDMK